MQIAHYVTRIGEMDEDEMWGAFTDWEGLHALFQDPHGWITQRNDAIRGIGKPALPPLASGVITFVVTYQFESTASPNSDPPLACETKNAPPLPLFVLSGRRASVVQVRIRHAPVSGAFPRDLSAWIPTGGALLHTPSGSRHIPGGSVIEFHDGATVTVPEVNSPSLTLQPEASLAYLHFPLHGSVATRFFIEVARDPQGFIDAARRHLDAGLVQVGDGSASDTKLRLVDLVDDSPQAKPIALSQFRVIYQSYWETPSTNICGKITAKMAPTADAENSYDLEIDTVLGYTY